MALQKISEFEVVSSDGHRITIGAHVLTYILGTRYLTIPVEVLGDAQELRISLSQSSAWMENGRSCNSEGTLDMTLVRARVSQALRFLGRNFSFDR